MPAQVSDQEREQYLNDYAERLSRVDEVQPLFFHPRKDYDEHQQLKPGVLARSGVQWNPRASQTFQESASSFAGQVSRLVEPTFATNKCKPADGESS